MTTITLPPIAEGVTAATVSYIYVKRGDKVREGESLMELVTDKATFNLPSPNDGTVAEILASEGDQITVGQDLIHLE